MSTTSDINIERKHQHKHIFSGASGIKRVEIIKRDSPEQKIIHIEYGFFGGTPPL